MQKYLLAPININVSAKDRENLIKVFYANLILAKNIYLELIKKITIGHMQ